jgi:hypothetical protein
MRIDAPSITGSFVVNNATLPDISGLATVSGNTFTGNQVINGTIVATGTTLVSGSAQISYTGLTNTPSGIVSSSNQVTTYGFSTTGSNTFQGIQTVNGSLVVTGSLTAQQFIVSSSVTYLTTSFASGSTKFGDSADDNHNFTGSFYVNGTISSTSTVTNRGIIIDGANNGNIAKLNFTRTDNSWGIHNETNLRVYVGSGNTTSPATKTLEITTAGQTQFPVFTSNANISLQSNPTAIELYNTSGLVRNWQISAQNINSQCIDFTPSTANGGTTYSIPVLTIDGEQNRVGIGTGTSRPTANGLTIYQGGGDKRTLLELNRPNTPGLQTALQFTVGNSILVGQIQHEYTASNQNHMSFTLRNPSGSNIVPLWLQNDGSIGMGTTTPSYNLDIQGAEAKLQLKNNSTGGGTYVLASTYNSWSAGGGKFVITSDGGSAGIKFAIDSSGNIGMGTYSPVTKLDVSGNIKYSGRVFSSQAIIGSISGNLTATAGTNYILVNNLNDAAGFSMVGHCNAASWTCWNISQIWIQKNYSSTACSAGITGLYKAGGCNMSIVDLSYNSGRYIAIGYTSNPEIDVVWTGYSLISQFGSDGSATVVAAANVTINSTLASY